MAVIRLYLDEDVRPLLARTLRARGYDATSAVDLGRIQIPDQEHFQFAAGEGRAILTFNIRDFVPIALRAIEDRFKFSGLIVSDQIEFRELLRRTLRLLGSRQSEEIENSIVWLSDYR
jgi:predicted nuclease of predicted toxin-antitoxin system